MAEVTQDIKLPPPASDQAFMNVSALEGGILAIPSEYVVTGVPPSEVISCPSLCFFLRHSKTGAHLVFDLGIRRDVESYPPSIQARIKKFNPVNVDETVPDSLGKGGFLPGQVETVVLSHLHWDHIGDSAPFTNATFVVGGACRSIIDSGHLSDPTSLIVQNAIPLDRTRFLSLSDFATSIGPFPRTFDYFGDGSMYIVDAPGHLAGHVNIFARTSADGAWIFLAGDSAHDFRLVTGEKEIAVRLDAAGHIQCSHANKEDAAETIRRIGSLLNVPRVQILIAHDSSWYNENKGGPAFFPGTIPPL
ncbi:hypothetical protein SERLA73DRAFT_93143 [Serpula lacrymans var. lacrymans S7.3]|uniref:Metallo-beta-lactamase domain-containing protein n=2 Tax=Serpula lacrymans var. lacrymans TaxID=341189 RepID=F8Q4Y3_SERL3|nr:uncharacterized protein SERLADRAFT_451064 [Serpula lacrymans var. lacrymans S7.9]EGN96610.1 hypothetical protein SERLA73DRAFT_93143 [Serpula lacrymans var. lacrymans S7.3]EGO22179.1 hypothetical protein SERLADRAFT_451064 [Serpula lacrymans var. lacrymans S7.9]